MFESIHRQVAGRFSGERALDVLVNLWSHDRWFDFAHFRRSASYSAEQFAAAGLSQVETIPFAADGETTYGDWVAPLAWDVMDAELEIRAPRQLPICRYTDLPVSLAMWSGPTPAEGVEADVVLVEDSGSAPVESLEPDPRLRGKILFGGRHAAELKRLAVRNGAIGVISDFHAAYGPAQPPRPPDKVSWVNVWSDHPFGWPFTRADTPAFGFSLSARQGQVLADLLASGQPVRAWARADTRLYSGSFDFVTGVLPGRRSDEEVLVFAHLYEQGAQDNAGGCASVIEAARCLSSLVRAGQLPQPERSIRFVLSSEIYGLLAYATTRPDAMRRIVAGLNLDSMGVPAEISGARLVVHGNPNAQASFTDILLRRLAEAHLAPDAWELGQFDTTDAVIADPSIGVPTPWLGEMISSLWHSSLDTPEKIDPGVLGREGALAATYLYAVASAGPEEARWLAREVRQDALDSLAAAGAGQANGGAARRVWRLADQGNRTLASCRTLDRSPELERLLRAYQDEVDAASAAATATAAVAATASGTGDETRATAQIPTRVVTGGLSLGGLPRSEWVAAQVITRGENPRWSAPLCCALYWVDGRRDLAEIQELVDQEFDAGKVDVAAYFGYLARHGYLRWKS